MFYGLSTNEKFFNDRVNIFVALAPCVSLENSKFLNSMGISMFVKIIGYLKIIANNLGIYELCGKGWEIQFERILHYFPDLSWFKVHEIFFNKEIDDKIQTKIYQGHFPHGASTKSIVHYA
jgi:hypothetical protein